MIQVICPPSGRISYLSLRAAMIGPLEIVDSIPGSTTEHRSSIDFLNQWEGIGGVDNNVQHRTVDGTVFISPLHVAKIADMKYTGFSGFEMNTWDPERNMSYIAWKTEGRMITYVSCSVYLQNDKTYIDWYERYTVTIDPEYANYRPNCIYSIKGNSSIFKYQPPFKSGKLFPSGFSDLLSLETWESPYWQHPGVYCSVTSFDWTKPIDISVYLRRMQSDHDTKVARKVFIPEMKGYSELAAEAVVSCKTIDTNMIGFLRDLRNPAELIPKLKKLKGIKDVANEYLRANYGILPTISDLKAIIEGFSKHPFEDKLGNEVYTAGQSRTDFVGGCLIERTNRIKIAVAPEEKGWQKVYQEFMKIGLFPSFNNLWDLVPYSFVIDWFVDIGSFLESVDTRLLYQTMDILYTTMSSKVVTRTRLSPSFDLPVSADLSQRHYHRRVSNQCPVPPISLRNNDEFGHVLESAALIVQRKH